MRTSGQALAPLGGIARGVQHGLDGHSGDVFLSERGEPQLSGHTGHGYAA